MGYPSETFVAGQGCSGISFFGTGGQGFFFCPRTWVAVVLGLTIISVEGYLSNSFSLCAGYAEAGKFQDDILP